MGNLPLCITFGRVGGRGLLGCLGTFTWLGTLRNGLLERFTRENLIFCDENHEMVDFWSMQPIWRPQWQCIQTVEKEFKLVFALLEIPVSWYGKPTSLSCN